MWSVDATSMCNSESSGGNNLVLQKLRRTDPQAVKAYLLYPTVGKNLKNNDWNSALKILPDLFLQTDTAHYYERWVFLAKKKNWCVFHYDKRSLPTVYVLTFFTRKDAYTPKTLCTIYIEVYVLHFTTTRGPNKKWPKV